MIVSIILAVAGLAAAGWVIWASRTDAAVRRANSISEEAWKRAEAGADRTDKLMLRIARHFAGVGQVFDSDATLQRKIQAKLLAAGGAYGADVNIFWAAQAGAVLAAAIFAVLGALGVLPVFITGFGVFLMAVFPYGRLNSKAKTRAREIDSALPDFAELLLMPLSAGHGIDEALQRTADRSTGPVADEVKNLMHLLRTKAYSTSDAYQLAGDRLGTQAARSFFLVLRKAVMEGSKVMESLERQAVSLREAWYQKKRAEIKQLPVKMILVFALFFMPVLLMFALLPGVISLGTL